MLNAEEEKTVVPMEVEEPAAGCVKKETLKFSYTSEANGPVPFTSNFEEFSKETI